MAPRGFALDPTEAKALLTADKLARFATYQKTVSSPASDATGTGKGAKTGMGAAPAGDDHAARFAAARKTALDKSGLTQDEAAKLTQLLTPY
jgi:hypothetical protein